MTEDSAPKRRDRGLVVWLMGPTSGGKTTIARLLRERMGERGLACLHFDGDEVRGFFGEGHGFDAADRLRVVKTLAHLAGKASDAGVHAVISALTANEDARRHVHEALPGVIVVYVKCSIDVCRERDPKGLYALADKGEIDTLIGVNSAYLAPENPDLVIDTETLSPAEAVDRLWAHMAPTAEN